MGITRRTFVAAAAGAPLALTLGTRAASAADFGLPYDYPVALAPPFAHGVASGDPLADRVILWTRLTLVDPTRAGTIDVRWEAATDPGMTTVIGGGTVPTDSGRDWTVKVDAPLPQPGMTYYYRFHALGASYIVGRTRTAPAADVTELRYAVVACASYFSAHFNAFGRIADRNDIDGVLHCGDHVYDSVDEDEWVRSRGPMNEVTNLDFRDWNTVAECRRRYALYYSDPNFLRMHQQHPISILWDNHDIDSGTAITQAEAQATFWEWVPCRPPKGDGSGVFPAPDGPNVAVTPEDPTYVHRSLPAGPMADIVVIDVRSKRVGDSLLGPGQRQWFLNRMAASKAGGVRWRLVINGFPMAQIKAVNAVGASAFPGNPTAGGVQFYGAWDTFDVERSRVLSGLRAAGVRNNIVLTGDAHGNFASDLCEDPTLPAYEPATGGGTLGSVGVEFQMSSVGRGGADETLAGTTYRQATGHPPKGDRAGFAPHLAAAQVTAVGVEEALMAANETLRYIEWRSHGYGIVHLTATRATLEHWWQPILSPSTDDLLGAQHTVALGSDHITRVALPSATSGSRIAAPAPDDTATPVVSEAPSVPGLAIGALAVAAAATWAVRRRTAAPANEG